MFLAGCSVLADEPCAWCAGWTIRSDDVVTKRTSPSADRAAWSRAPAHPFESDVDDSGFFAIVHPALVECAAECSRGWMTFVRRIRAYPGRPKDSDRAVFVGRRHCDSSYRLPEILWTQAAWNVTQLTTHRGLTLLPVAERPAPVLPVDGNRSSQEGTQL